MRVPILPSGSGSAFDPRPGQGMISAGAGGGAPADQIFAVASVKGFSSTANFSCAGNLAFGFTSGDVICGSFTLDNALPGGLTSFFYSLLSGGTTLGFNCIASGGTLQLSVYPSTNSCVVGALRKGINRFVFYNDGFNIRGSLNGAAVVVEALGTFVQPTALATFVTGGSIFGSGEIPGRLTELIHVPAASLPSGLSDTLIVAYAGSVLPSPSAGTVPTLAWMTANAAGSAGRWLAPTSLSSLADVYFAPGLQWAGGSAATVTTGGTSPKSWTVNSPSSLSIDTGLSERLVQNIGPAFSDTLAPYAETSDGLVVGDPMKRLVFTLPINMPDYCIGYANNDTTSGNTTLENTGVYVGAASDTKESASNWFGLVPSGNATADGLARPYWTTVEAASGVTPTAHPIWHYDGVRAIHPLGPTGVVQGGYIQWVIVPTVCTFGEAAPAKCLIYDGDSITLGLGGTYTSLEYGMTPLRRRAYPTSGGPGAVIDIGYSGRSLYDYSHSFAALVASCVARVQRTGASHVDHVFELGINDYYNAWQHVAAWQSDLQSYVTQLIAAYAAAGLTYTITLLGMPQAHFYTSANAQGDTLNAYKAAMAAITGSGVAYGDGATPSAIAFNSDFIHPLAAADAAAFESNAEALQN